jgi:hypothetical protein
MTLFSKVGFIFISLLCLRRFSDGGELYAVLGKLSKAMLPPHCVRRDLAKAVIGDNPAAGKKFRVAKASLARAEWLTKTRERRGLT